MSSWDDESSPVGGSPRTMTTLLSADSAPRSPSGMQRRDSFKQSSKRQSVSAHEGAQLSFEVIKINKAGVKQQRKLKLSRAGISNEKGSSTQWFHPSDDVFEIAQDAEKLNTFSVSVLTSYVFEAKSAKDVERIIQSFERLQMGRVVKRASSAYVLDSQGRQTTVSRNTHVPFNFSDTGEEVESEEEVEDTAGEHIFFNPCTSTVENARFLPLSLFTLFNMIGRGSFGKVILASFAGSTPHDTLCALKLLHKGTLRQQKQLQNVERERAVMAKLNHPLICKLIGTSQTRNYVIMVLEYVPGGELSRYVKASTYPLPELVARTVIAEIIAAVGYLHQQGIIYRDLKPENVLVDALGHMRLTDFGLAKENMAGVSTKTFCGTPDFQAPEIIRGDYYDLSVDWWSVGCILYELLYRVSPFYAVSRHMVYSKIIDAQYSFPSEARLPVSDDAKDLVRQFLQKEPSERLCEYSKIKDHPFFAGVDWAAVETGRAQPAFVPRLPRRDPKDIGEPIDTLLLKELASSTAGFHSPTDLYLDGF